MDRRYSVTHLILASVIVLVLTLLMVCVDAQAQIAFSSNRDGNWEIYMMDIDGKNQRRLTNNRHDDWEPSWSPDGKRIAFMSDRDGHVDVRGWPTGEIYVMDADGGNQQNLTNNPGRDSSPSWSPEGKRIAFSSNRDARKGDFIFEIYVMDADGGNPQNLTNNLKDDQYPSWSPDGKRIVFSARRDGHFENKFSITDEIYVMDADGGNQQRLTENRKNDWHPVWSPDGKRIVFSSYRTEHFRGEFGITYEIYVMDANGQNQQNLTNNRGNDGSPSWSPDGKRIAFSSYRDGHFQSAEIYVMDADGGNQRILTNNGHADYSPSWSPDGERIAFSSSRDGNWEIYVMGANGGNQRILTKHGSHNLAPTWYTPAFAVAPAD